MRPAAARSFSAAAGLGAANAPGASAGALFLRDATFIDWRSRAIRRGHLEVAEGPEGGIRFVREIPRGAEVLEASGRIVTKSFVIAHHHLYSSLAVGMPPPRRRPGDFAEMLRLVWWRLDRALDRDMIRACALAGGLEAAKSGVTFVVDHHSSPNAVEGSLDAVAQALEEIGISHLLCYELSDRDGARRRERALEETDRYLRRRPGLVGLHASFTVSAELLGAAAELARRHRTGVHVHAAEARSDEEDCRRRHGRRVLERFAEAGLLESPRTLLAHGVHFDGAERALFRRSRAWLVQNAESNQNNGVGTLEAAGLGERLLIGTDGMHGDALRSARAAYLAARSGGDASPDAAYRRLRAAHDYLSSNRFPGDGENNLVVLNYAPPTPVTSENWPAHVAYGLDRRHVESVIARGRLVVDRGLLARVDEGEIRRFANEQTERLWRKL